jgi:hypothetical protein
MAVPFGFSVGDFVAAIGLVREVIGALGTASSSTTRYHGLMFELFSLERALLEVKALKFDESNHPQLDALRCAATKCHGTIDGFLQQIKKYQPSLTARGSGLKWKDALRKVQWALFTDNDLERFRVEIHGHTGSIAILLLTVQM